METLPHDVLVELMWYLDGTARKCFLMVCKHWLSIGKRALVHWFYRDRTLTWVVSNNIISVVREILEDPLKRVHPGFWNNWCIRAACEYGYKDIVLLLLEDSRVNPADYRNGALLVASERGRSDIVQKLLQNPKVKPIKTSAIFLACKYGHLSVVEHLMNYKPQGPDEELEIAASWMSGFLAAAENGHKSIVSSILNSKYADKLNLERALIEASSRGHKEVIVRLLKEERLDPSQYTYALSEAAIRGHINVAVELLRVKKLRKVVKQDERRISNEAIQSALALASDSPTAVLCQLVSCRNIATCCDVDLIIQLVNEPAMSTHRIGKLFQCLCGLGALETVKKLLKHERVDPTYEHNYAIRWAAEAGRTEVVKVLLEDPRVDPSDSDQSAVRIACINGRLDTVKLLLSDKRVDPSVYRNDAFIGACRENKLEVVKVLLADPRVDPSDRDNEALKTCETPRFKDIYNLLLTDSGVKQKYKQQKKMDKEKRKKMDEEKYKKMKENKKDA